MKTNSTTHEIGTHETPAQENGSGQAQLAVEAEGQLSMVIVDNTFVVLQQLG
ncbi:hypothetical protein [Paenibacillus sp. 32352]|uniref:hypothetical protein n=1 Tax=Paenibacillus sp. 32352 TaxID=1969111 RepID=UPI0015C4DECB|nr:hypothetical protein [Paenibacillus sp. 32352]